MGYKSKYKKINWQDYPSTNTPVDSVNLEIMDAAILEHDQALENIDMRVDELYSAAVTIPEYVERAKNEANRSEKEADRAKSEADRAKREADRAFDTTPEGYENVVKNVTTIKKDLDELITTSNSDLTNSANGSIASAKFVGYGRKSKNLFKPITLVAETKNGVTFTPHYNSKGQLEYVNVNGTASANALYYFGEYVNTDKKSIIVSKGNANINFDIYRKAESTSSNVEYWNANDLTTTDYSVRVYIGIVSGKTVTNEKVYPMIRLSTVTDATYEPYGIISPSGIVKSSNGNKHSEVTLPYTPLGVNTTKDELIVFADGSGKYIKRVGEVDLSTMSWTQNDINVHRYISYSLDGKIKNRPESDWRTKPLTISAPYTSVGYNQFDAGNDNQYSTVFPGNIGTGIGIRDSRYSTISDFVNGVRGVQLIYELATPIEMPLTATEVEQILSLKTFDNITYVDADGMDYEIGYYDDSTMGNALGGVGSRVANIGNEVAENKAELDVLQRSLDDISKKKSLSILGTSEYFSGYITATSVNGIIYVDFKGAQTIKQVPAWTTFGIISSAQISNTPMYGIVSDESGNCYPISINASGQMKAVKDIPNGKYIYGTLIIF